MAAAPVRAKRVRWSTITIHEFGVGHGGSAVPKSGPSIGLARVPEFTWSTSVGTMARECDGVRRFSAAERCALLRAAGFSRDRVDAFVAEAKTVRSSRELYYSSEMKCFRKKRKQTKAEARASRTKRTVSSSSPPPRPVPAAIDGVDHDEMKPAVAVQLRIDVADSAMAAPLPDETAASAPAKACTPLLPPPLPLSPCCS